ncbi:hypothetical protein DXG03_007475 [Asterophora parasitica]|uniref:Uncharacterized protein n=1 Tax=Asterophora parasitica TaxID=117018 RepID=A0A9P7K1S8_9AGAR|nr:hypothetical protein DXG03_007475 [Asterophora parasitica]
MRPGEHEEVGRVSSHRPSEAEGANIAVEVVVSLNTRWVVGRVLVEKSLVVRIIKLDKSKNTIERGSSGDDAGVGRSKADRAVQRVDDVSASAVDDLELGRGNGG